MPIHLPYRSRLFNFLRLTSRRVIDHWQQQARQGRVKALWGIQLALFPAYRLLQRQKLMGGKGWLTRGWQQLRNWSGTEAITQLTPPADQPIQQLLDVIQIDCQPVEDLGLETRSDVMPVLRVEIQPLPSQPGWKTWPKKLQGFWQQAIEGWVDRWTEHWIQPLTLFPKQPQRLLALRPQMIPQPVLLKAGTSGNKKSQVQGISLQGVAVQLASQELVLVGQGNQILPLLAPAQQRQIQQRLVWELAAYYRQVRRVALVLGHPLRLPRFTPDPVSFAPDRGSAELLPVGHSLLSRLSSNPIPNQRTRSEQAAQMLGQNFQAWIGRCRHWLDQFTRSDLAPMSPIAKVTLAAPLSASITDSITPVVDPSRLFLTNAEPLTNPVDSLSSSRLTALATWPQVLKNWLWKNWQTTALVLFNSTPSLISSPASESITALPSSQSNPPQISGVLEFIFNRQLTAASPLVAAEACLLERSASVDNELSKIRHDHPPIQPFSTPNDALNVKTVVVGYEKHWLEHILIIFDQGMVWIENLAVKFYQWSLQGLFKPLFHQVFQPLFRHLQKWWQS